MPAAMINKMTFKLTPGLVVVKSFRKVAMIRSGLSNYIISTKRRKLFSENIGSAESKNHESYKLEKFAFNRIPCENNDLLDEDFVEFVFKVTASNYYINKAKSFKYLVFRVVDNLTRFEFFVNLDHFRVNEDTRSIEFNDNNLNTNLKDFEKLWTLFEASAPNNTLVVEITFSNTKCNYKSKPLSEPITSIKKDVREVKRLPHVLAEGVIYKRQTKNDSSPRYFIKDGDGYREITLPGDR